MAAFDEDFGASPARKLSHEIGQDLSRVSVEELRERVGLLREEIARLEREIASKSAHKSAADQLFRR